MGLRFSPGNPCCTEREWCHKESEIDLDNEFSYVSHDLPESDHTSIEVVTWGVDDYETESVIIEDDGHRVPLPVEDGEDPEDSPKNPCRQISLSINEAGEGRRGVALIHWIGSIEHESRQFGVSELDCSYKHRDIRGDYVNPTKPLIATFLKHNEKIYVDGPWEAKTGKTGWQDLRGPEGLPGTLIELTDSGPVEVEVEISGEFEIGWGVIAQDAYQLGTEGGTNEKFELVLRVDNVCIRGRFVRGIRFLECDTNQDHYDASSGESIQYTYSSPDDFVLDDFAGHDSLGDGDYTVEEGQFFDDNGDQFHTIDVDFTVNHTTGEDTFFRVFLPVGSPPDYVLEPQSGVYDILSRINYGGTGYLLPGETSGVSYQISGYIRADGEYYSGPASNIWSKNEWISTTSRMRGKGISRVGQDGNLTADHFSDSPSGYLVVDENVEQPSDHQVGPALIFKVGSDKASGEYSGTLKLGSYCMTGSYRRRSSLVCTSISHPFTGWELVCPTVVSSCEGCETLAGVYRMDDLLGQSIRHDVKKVPYCGILAEESCGDFSCEGLPEGEVWWYANRIIKNDGEYNECPLYLMAGTQMGYDDQGNAISRGSFNLSQNGVPNYLYDPPKALYYYSGDAPEITTNAAIFRYEKRPPARFSRCIGGLPDSIYLKGFF